MLNSILSGLNRLPLLFAVSFAVDVASVDVATGQVPDNVLAVNPSASPGGDGTSWANALTSLQAALFIVHLENSPFNEIWLAQGVYYPDRGPNQSLGDRDATFHITRSNLKIIGGFEGLDTSAAIDPETWVSILSGDINEPDILGDNTYHIMKITGGVENVRIEGLTFSKGVAVDANGGAARIEDSSASFVRCKFIDNGTSVPPLTAGSGGAVYCVRNACDAGSPCPGTVNFIGCTF